MQTVSDEFKQMCKSNTPSGAIGRIRVIEDDITIAENTDIQNISIEDNCYVNDKFIGTTVAKKVTVNLFNDDNIYDLENKEIEVKLGFDLDGTEELISFGNYVIEKPETEEVQAKTNFIGYDYMIKFNKSYVDTNEYPISLADYFTNLCNQVGVEVGNIDFVNADYMVQGNAFTNNEDCRTVLSAIAQIAGGIAKIGRDNKVYIINLSAGDILEELDGNNYDTFTPNKVFGPINKVILRMNSGVDGEESVRTNEESISQNGECAIVIADNPILNSHEQQELVIDNIFNALNGIAYLPYKTTYYGYPYADSTDEIKISNVNDTEYNSYIFNHTINYDGSFSGDINTSALSKTQSMYKNTNDIKSRFRRTELAVDKINGEIKSIVEEQTETQQQIVQVTQNIKNIQNLFQITGGSNLIQNSTGLFGLEEAHWIKAEGGTYEPYGEDASLIGETISASQLTVGNGSLVSSNTNIINLSLQEVKSLSFKYKQDENTTTTVKVYGMNEDKPFYSETFTGEQKNWKEVSTSFNIDVPNIFIKIESTSTLEGVFNISDLMLNNGDKKSWEPSANEIWGTVVKLSQIGLQVYSVQGNICTLMTSTGFQIREYNNNTIGDIITDFTRTGINTGDITQTGTHTQDKLVSKKITDDSNNEIYVEYIKD